jgi:hypothetical protein
MMTTTTTTMTREEKARLVGRFEPRRGGHAPGHLREAFVDWVDGGAEAETVVVGYAETEMPIGWLLGVLWNCPDIMPSDLCRELDMLQGSTYAQAVRRLKRERGN